MISTMAAKKPKPDSDRHKLRLLGIRLPPDLTAKLRKLAAKNYRTITAEIQIALEKHLAENPVE